LPDKRLLEYAGKRVRYALTVVDLVNRRPIMKTEKWVVYLVRCADKSFYCGITNNLNSRLTDHNSGKGAKYTRSRKPVELVGVSPEMSKSNALKLEYRIKQLPANKKLSELTEKENLMTITKKDLQALKKDIKALEKKMGKLISVAEKNEKPKVAKKTKAKTVKKTPAKKALAKKKTTQTTATEEVLKIVKRSKKGVDTAILMKKTGFDQKKVWNILQRTYKQGKITRVGKGIYVGA
jgi:putative endonuclease